MGNLGDILGNKQLPQEPAEFGQIRQFVQDNFDVTPRLTLRDQSIIISVPGSAVAGSLRFKLPELQTALQTDRHLVIVSH